MTLKKSLAVTTAAALALSLAACSSDSDSDSNGASGDGASGGDNYVVVNGTEPQNPLVPAGRRDPVFPGDIRHRPLPCGKPDVPELQPDLQHHRQCVLGYHGFQFLQEYGGGRLFLLPF